MQQNPYLETCVRNVVELTNRPPVTLAELVERWLAAGMTLDRAAVRRDLDEVREFLPRWAELVDAPSEQRRIELLNGLLAQHASHPRLTCHAGDERWHLHYRDDGLGLAAILRATASVFTAQFFAERGLHRVGRCASSDCHAIYADFTRAGRQWYCSHPCANRDAVRRHRAKGAGAPGSAAQSLTG